MKSEVNLGLTQDCRQQADLRITLEQHWDKKLTRTETNPYPLAPLDLTSSGEVNELNYLFFNTQFGNFCSRKMQRIVRRMSTRFSSRKNIQILGVGLGRDIDWISEAVRLNYFLTLRDVSHVACENANRFVSLYPSSVEVKLGELEEEWNPQEISLQGTSIVFASQFIQVQTEQKMKGVMSLLSSILCNDETDSIHKRIYLVHPCKEDNNKEVTWNGRIVPAPLWGDTTPYSRAQLRSAICESANKKIKLRTLGKVNYFHQVYSFLEFGVSRG